MKIAISYYGRFEYEPLGLFLNEGDSFIVTPKIEKSKQFQLGLQRGKFEFVSKPDLALVQRAHGVTEKMLKDFVKEITAVPEPEKETVTINEPEKPIAGEHPVEEVPPAEVTPAEPTQPEIEEMKNDPILPFTEEAGNIKAAKVAIGKENDIEKLKFALEHDSRKTVKEALEARLNELA